jgi:hypothetical protein
VAFGKDLMSPDVFMDMVSDAWLCVCVALIFGLILGMRDIKIKTQVGNELGLQDVRYVPRACRNLISLGELHDGDYVYHVYMDKLIKQVKNEKKMVLKGKRTRNNLNKVLVSIILGGGEKEEAAVGSA